MAVVNSSRFDFSDLVGNMLQQYGVHVAEAMTKSVNEVAKEAAQKLKAESPKGNTGIYSSGWAVKYERGKLTTSATVYGKSGTYQLAHLLEKGHANRGGGRTRAIVHISPVERWAIEEAWYRTVERLGAL